MQRIFLAPILFWCFSIMTAFGLPSEKQEFTELIQMDNQEEAERRLDELLNYRSYEEAVNLIRWFTTPMDEHQFSFPSFIFIASGNQRLTLLLINRMAAIINQQIWLPPSEALLHTLINTELFYSVSAGYPERVEYLLDQHPNHIRIFDHNTHSLLSYAVRHGHNEIIRALMQRQAPDYLDRNGNTLMHLAVHYNQTSTIRLLLSLGYPVNRRNLRGETPLFLSILEGRELATKQLLAHGANADIADNQGRRPLQLAISTGQANQVILLIEQRLSFIESSLESYAEVQAVEAITVNHLITNGATTSTYSDSTSDNSAIRNQHCQNLQRLCQNLRRFASLLNQALQLNQTVQLSLSHNVQLLGPEHQHRLQEQHQQVQALTRRLQQVLQCLQNDLQQIRQDVSTGQQY